MIHRPFVLIGVAASNAQRQAQLQSRICKVLREARAPMTLAQVMAKTKSQRHATETALERLASRKLVTMTRVPARRLRVYEAA